MSKLPAFQFYPGDWMKDPDLRRCSHGARGVWMDMLCLMFECGSRGVLATGCSPWSREDVAAAVGGNADVTLRCIDELIAKGVCKVRDDGALYSSRMVRDDEERVKTRERVSKHRVKQDCNATCNGDVTPMSQCSSSSSSSSDKTPSTPRNGLEKNPQITPPTLEQVNNIATMRSVSTDCAEQFFHDNTARGWRDAKQCPIVDWPAALTAYGNRWRANEHQRKQQSNGTSQTRRTSIDRNAGNSNSGLADEYKIA